MPSLVHPKKIHAFWLVIGSGIQNWIHFFFNKAIIWHSIVPVFLKIYTDLQEICSILFVSLFLGPAHWKLFRNNNDFAFIRCKFLANLYKSSEIIEQFYVKWWLKYRNNRSVSWRISCKGDSLTQSLFIDLEKKQDLLELLTQNR